ncbi:MAG: thioredoxin-disulfide reductase [Candidatus Bathyarchaeota archaeon]|nr:thioredoxin-disulfide reductase [Candidatus Bathyarchaeota archaeon]MDH5495384.1 thioredoxin-disulfide reductase [Candidatus Bathyarchaeota archaeon]
MENWDLIIIGAGPAGLTAGIYAGRSRLKTLILEEKTPGGEAAVAPWIENYPGFESISGLELIEKMTKHCERFGAQINGLEKVVSLDLKGEEKLVKTDKNAYSASAVIIATGTHNRLLNVLGEEKFQGRGVSYCALCDGAFFKGKKVIVVGGGNSAAMSARYLSNIAANVKLVHRKDQLRTEEACIETLKKQNVEFLWNSKVKEVKGDGVVKSVILQHNKTGEVKKLEVDGVFVQIGEIPNTNFVKNAGVAVDKDGYIIVDARQRTNVQGVFAAGDVTNGPVKQIGTAVGQAIVTATEAFGYIKRPYYYKG